MKCASCQNEIPPYSTFCTACGTAIGVGGGAAAAPALMKGSVVDTTAGACAYLTLLPAVCLLCMERHKRSEFVRFHAIQCIALTLFAAALLLLLEVTGVVGRSVSAAVAAIFVAGWVVAIWKARSGEMYELPLVGELAAKRCKVHAEGRSADVRRSYAA